MRLKRVPGIVLIFSLATVVCLENDSCFESHLKAYGTCQALNECSTSYDAFTNYNITFDLCGYSSGVPVVCCVEGLRQRLQASPGSTPSGLEQASHQRPPADAAEDKMRISEKKCEEYSRSVTLTYGVIPLLFEPEITTFKQPRCNYTANPLVVGGKEADLGEFPHMAAIGWPITNGPGYAWLCGGSLISERFVLTAAHCTYHRGNTEAESGRPVAVRLGDHDLRDRVPDGAQPLTLAIQDIAKHPGFTSPSKYDDIALLRLAAPVQFNDFVRPACLYTNPKLTMKSVIATGWGTTSKRAKVSSNVLRKVSLKVFSNEECQPNFVYNRNWKVGFSKDQMCAGDDRGGKDTCQGDSGGPLQIESPDNACIFYIVAVTGFGEECGNAQGSGVYAIVSHYIDWIEQNVWPSTN